MASKFCKSYQTNPTKHHTKPKASLYYLHPHSLPPHKPPCPSTTHLNPPKLPAAKAKPLNRTPTRPPHHLLHNFISYTEPQHPRILQPVPINPQNLSHHPCLHLPTLVTIPARVRGQEPDQRACNRSQLW